MCVMCVWCACVVCVSCVAVTVDVGVWYAVCCVCVMDVGMLCVCVFDVLYVVCV